MITEDDTELNYAIHWQNRNNTFSFYHDSSRDGRIGSYRGKTLPVYCQSWVNWILLSDAISTEINVFVDLSRASLAIAICQRNFKAICLRN
jgi:hypothetical protein